MLLALSACGYALVGKGTTTDPSIKRIGVPNFTDRTAKPALDQKIMGMYVGLPRYYTKTANIIGSNIGGAISDNAAGMPHFPNMFLKS